MRLVTILTVGLVSVSLLFAVFGTVIASSVVINLATEPDCDQQIIAEDLFSAVVGDINVVSTSACCWEASVILVVAVRKFNGQIVSLGQPLPTSGEFDEQ